MIKTSLRTVVRLGMGVGVWALPWMADLAAAQPLTQRVYDEQLRVLLDQQSPTQRDVTVDTGGWLSLGILDYDDGPVVIRRTLRQSQLRGWSQVNIRDTHAFYVRGLLDYDDWNGNTNPTGQGDDFYEKLERAWYRLDVNRFCGWDTSGPVNLGFKAGRDFQTIGNSLVLSIPLDMLNVQADVYQWQVTAFVGTTVYRSLNIDPSPLVYYHQDRVLAGTEWAYEGFSDHRPFVYFLGNWDHTGPSSSSLLQSYKYDSRYIGAGSRGILRTDEVRYAVELVGQWGRTYSNGAVSGRDRIEAYAFDALLEYLIDHPTYPKASVEYMFGSGDPDRTTSAVATAGGNTINTHDNAFNAFGFRDTGMASALKISNLHIFTGGVSLFPSARLKDLETGAKVFLYTKDRDGGAISDTSATNGAGWVGWEWDLFCNWRWTSDLAGTIRYGTFHPGSAYNGGDTSSRDFLYTGLVFSF